MKRLAIALPALLFLAAAPAAAQKMDQGKWTGSVTPPGGGTTMVTYDVTMKGDTIGIRIDAGEHGAFPANDVKLAGEKLTFWFSPGPRVDCTLTQREDGAFAGECVDPDGGTASMVMSPPKKG